jgi:tetratricopeptide (TPR) repeat protein
VEWLVAARLITPVEGGEGYELAHERLIPALRQVAKQELSAASRANVLLEQRVNEWLGNGRSGRYLLRLGELRLLRQQRAFLVWGDRQAQKRELLARSWRRVVGNMVGLSVPVVAAAGFGVWSHTPPGQIQWARWQLMDLDRLVDFERSGSSEETFTALTLDAVVSAKGPVPLGQYWGWEAPVSAGVGNPLVRLTHTINTVKDKALAKQLLNQALVVAQANKSSAAKATSLSAIAKSANQLNDSAGVKQLLNQVLMSAQSLSVDGFSKATVLEAIMESANQLNDSAGVKQLLRQVSVEAQSIKEVVSKANVLRSIAESYRQFDDRASARDLLSQAQQLAKSIPTGDFNKANVLMSIAESYRQLDDRASAQFLLSQAQKAAQLIPAEDSRKANALSMIAESYRQLNERATARSLLSQAQKTAQSIPREDFGEEDSSKVYALSMIAESYRQLNDYATARFLLSQALAVVESSKNKYNKDSLLAKIIQTAVHLDEGSTVQQVVNQALKVADSIEDKKSQTSSILNISNLFIKLKDEERAKRLLFKFLSTLKSYESTLHRPSRDGELIHETDYAVQEIAEFTSMFKNRKNAKQVLEKMLSIHPSFQSANQYHKKEYSKISLVAIVVDSYIKLNDIDQARKLILELDNSGVVKSIENENLKALAFSKISESYRKIGDIPTAQILLIQATQSAEKLQDSNAISFVAQVHANRGNWGEALRLAQRCNGEDKVRVLARILRVHAEQQQPEFKALRELEAKEKEEN